MRLICASCQIKPFVFLVENEAGSKKLTSLRPRSLQLMELKLKPIPSAKPEAFSVPATPSPRKQPLCSEATAQGSWPGPWDSAFQSNREGVPAESLGKPDLC